MPDSLPSLLEFQVKHGLDLHFELIVEASDDKKIEAEVRAQLRKILEDVSEAFHSADDSK